MITLRVSIPELPRASAWRSEMFGEVSKVCEARRGRKEEKKEEKVYMQGEKTSQGDVCTYMQEEIYIENKKQGGVRARRGDVGIQKTRSA